MIPKTNSAINFPRFSEESRLTPPTTNSDQGVEFVDNRVEGAEFEALKWTLNPLWGQVPVLEIGDKKYFQSKAIMRLLARKHGLYGKNDEEHNLVDMVTDALVDWREDYAGICYGRDGDFEQAKAAFVKRLPKALTALSTILGDKSYILGNGAPPRVCSRAIF